MKVVPKPKPYSLARKYYDISQVYAEVIATRFDFKGKAEVAITNWQVRFVEMTFFHSRGFDTRYRIYFPIGGGRNIVVSLSKTAKKEEIIKRIMRMVECAKNVDAEGFRKAINDLIDYCKQHSPMLMIEYRTSRNYVIQPVKSLKIN